MKKSLKAGLLAFIFALAGTVSVPATAANIVISNDDGLTSNVKALYDALKAKGHDVIVSVPCLNQSGMSAAISLDAVMGPPGKARERLASDCRNHAGRSGDPVAGSMTRPGFERDFFYVEGTPVMALMYGLDIEAIRRWGRDPDIVLSGPNEGRNAGPMVISSGTVSNAQYAALRGIPAIALSGGLDLVGDGKLDNPQSGRVAALCAQLLERLRGSSRSGPYLPRGLALNVNFPDDLAQPVWKATQIGNYNAYLFAFRPGSGTTAPRIMIGSNPVSPTKGQERDEAAVSRTQISVSPMQAGYAGGQGNKWVKRAVGRK
jgi:5'-nucleotidase